MIKIYTLLLLVVLSFVLLTAWSFQAFNIKNNMNQKMFNIKIPSKPEIRNPRLIIKGSIPYWDQEKALASFKNNIGFFSYVNLFWYYMDSSGNVNKYEYANEDKNIVKLAHDNNVKADMVITNLSEFSGAEWDDGQRVEKMIEGISSRKYHISQIIEKLNTLNFDGVVIDYEQLKPSAKDDFTNFIWDLSLALHKNNKFLSVVLHPKTSEDNPDENGKFQDWKQLSLYADQLQIMGYGEHWDNSGPGPIASISWLKRILDYARSIDIPKEKIILGIPLYGYDWDTISGGNAKDLTYQDVEKLMIDHAILRPGWDEKSQSYNFSYIDKNNHKHEVWFENQRSTEAKINIAKSYGLLGITFWRLGEEDPNVWNIVK